MKNPGPAGERRLDNLALTFQEILTAIVRLRSNRQVVADSESFRAQILEALKAADQEGRRKGYSAEDIKLAVFAVVALLDESILNSRNPAFTDWHRQPLQERLFGNQLAGEIFFQNVQRLLGRNDSHDLADLLEVYYLCLLLGFSGRYHTADAPELKSIKRSVAEKIDRIRGGTHDLFPQSIPDAEKIPPTDADPWVRWLIFGALACILLCVLVFLDFKHLLGSGVYDLQAIAGRSHTEELR